MKRCLVWGSCVEVLGVGGCGRSYVKGAWCGCRCGEELCEEIARRPMMILEFQYLLLLCTLKKQ